MTLITILIMLLLGACAFYYEVKALNVAIKNKLGLVDPQQLKLWQIYKGSSDVLFVLVFGITFFGLGFVNIFAAIWLPLWTIQKFLDYKRTKK